MHGTKYTCRMYLVAMVYIICTVYVFIVHVYCREKKGITVVTDILLIVVGIIAYVKVFCTSRHTVVCRAAQEAVTPHVK